MSLEPKAKRRKMEPSIGGDETSPESSSTSAVHSPTKSLLRAPTGSPSGDFGSSVAHQYVTFISVESCDKEGGRERKSYEECRQQCELGDSWSYKYPLPLSKYPNLPVRTGNMYYDSVIGELERVGFKSLQVIAKGRSSTIVLAQHLHQARQSPDSEIVPVALKLNSGHARKVRLMSKSEVTDEMNIHKHLHHPNIVSWVSNINFKSRIGIAMEFCENGTLEQLIKMQDGRFLTEPVAQRYYRQIHSAVDYLHRLGFAHRDICLQNVLISANNVAKLSDFGHAVAIPTNNDLINDYDCGSLGYQAPELLQRTPYDPGQADIWSLGSLLYYMTVGRLPLGVVRADILARAHREIPFPDDAVMPLSHNLKDLLKAMLVFIPKRRFSLNRLAHHEWMTTDDGRLQIGNFHQVRQPQRTSLGELETRVRAALRI